MHCEWYYAVSNRRHGPISFEELRRLVSLGEIHQEDLVWTDGMEQWTPAAEIKALFPASPGYEISESLDSPETSRVAGNAAGQLVYATFLMRAAASIIDMLIFSALLVVICLLFIVIMAVLIAPIRNQPGIEAFMALGMLILGFAVMVLLPIVYFVLSEASSYRGTFGKAMLGLQVTDLEGKPITIGQSFGRFLAHVFLTAGATSMLGYLFALFTHKKQALHDIVAETVVIYKPPTRQKPRNPIPQIIHTDFT